ncbi:transposase [Hymenobacter sp. BT175]|uniref:transposase n=1 Tax=Hymenobacter translucens TaxID=2886507 RepID=UPI001D0EFA7E|nr:transposase [Hymenobacter translucens]MCC2548579.1 transposase [Hymenobacter translucens]
MCESLGRIARPGGHAYGHYFCRAHPANHIRERGPDRAGYDGAKRCNGSEAHIAVDTPGHLLSVVITPAKEPERAQVGELCRQEQEITGQTVEVGFGDQGYAGKKLNTQQKCTPLIYT